MTLFATPPPSPTRTPSGFGLLSKIKSHKENGKAQTSSPRLDRPVPSRYGSDGHQRGSSSILFSIPAEQGTGLKSRRLSLIPPEDGSPLLFVVDTCELDDEFISASKFGWKKEVGKGASATVKIMVRKSEKKNSGNDCFRYAVKEFRKKSSRESEEDYVNKVKSEYAIAKSLDHPNIVRTVRLCTHAGRWNHVMEYCQQGELFSLVDRKYLKSEDKQCIFKQVLRGVSYLHDNGIAHRDIKLENLLMTEDGHVKITDFGVSDVFCGDHPGLPSSHGLCGQQMKDFRKATPGICGSMPYISPEVFAKDQNYDPTKLDVWSCGILYLTLILGGNPWQSPRLVERTYKEFMQGWEAFLSPKANGLVDENNYPQCGSIFNKALSSSGQRRCILRMLNPNPTKRCTIREALMDRWTKKVECCCPESNQPLPSSNGLDVSKTNCNQIAAKMQILPRHDHLPPENTTYNRIPKPFQYRFDMGDGTSRYD